ncbi:MULTISPECIES: urease accessory protein UreE [Myroides]|uniref:urease accessory protein UreE n=1 Tax=Myroides TaxID=76831 RepID=UPI001303897F|nr:urease accessory protein UreE [Myroides phaeus]
MIITKALRNDITALDNSEVDVLSIEWFQTQKRIQRLRTASGREVAIKFMDKGQELRHGDVLVDDETGMVVVRVLPCDSIVVQFDDLLNLGLVAYEVGNKHLALFVKENKLLMPFERPIYLWLQQQGYAPSVQSEVLLHKLNANVDPGHNKRFSFQMSKTIMSIK